MTPSPGEVTQLLVDWGNGDKAALDRLTPLVHEELHRLAHRHMRLERWSTRPTCGWLTSEICTGKIARTSSQ